MHHVMPGMCKFYFRPCTTAVSHSGEPSQDTGVSLHGKQRGYQVNLQPLTDEIKQPSTFLFFFFFNFFTQLFDVAWKTKGRWLVWYFTPLEDQLNELWLWVFRCSVYTILCHNRHFLLMSWHSCQAKFNFFMEETIMHSNSNMTTYFGKLLTVWLQLSNCC